MRQLTARYPLLLSAALLVVALGFVVAMASPPAVAQPATITLFEGARLITGDASAPIEDSAFLVEGGRFTQVGRRGEVTAPSGAARVSLSGKTVIPGIVDAHGHPGFLDMVFGRMSKENFTRETYVDHLQRYAYHGVPAVISTGTDIGDLAFKLREETIPNAARILTVGRGLAYPGSGPADRSRNDVPFAVTSAEEARAAVRELALLKPDFVKIWVDNRGGRATKLTPEMFTAAAHEPKKPGRPPIGHALGLADRKLAAQPG